MLAWQKEDGKSGERLMWDALGSGLFRGEGLFETLLMLGRGVCAWEAHWGRLSQGAAKLGIDLPEENHAVELLCRFIDAEGVDDDGVRRRLRVTALKEGLFFGIGAAGELPDQEVLLSSPFCRNERGALVGLKAVSYAENTLALEEVSARGGTEALLTNTQGHWCEGTWSNVFAVQEGVIYTPPLSSGCLPGVTRGQVIELAAAEGFVVEEVNRPLSWLNECEEIFLTSSLRGIRSVRNYEGRKLEEDSVASRLQEAYEEGLSQLRLLL